MPTLTSLELAAAVGLAALVFLALRNKFPSLRMLSSPVEHAAIRRAGQAEDELDRANQLIEQQAQEIKDLHKERSLTAVIELVQKVNHGVEQTLDKLAEMNGGMRHATDALVKSSEGLETSTKAIEFLASQIVLRGDLDRDPPA